MDTTTEAYGPVIGQIVEQVFQTMLGLEVHPDPAPWPPAEPLLTASISLTGSWKGAVLVECRLKDALVFTSKMTGVDQPTELNDDVRDALGEMANMVGGNLKSVLPGGVELSLPSVVWGTDYTVGICHAGTAQRWVFTGGGTTFGVVVYEVNH